MPSSGRAGIYIGPGNDIWHNAWNMVHSTGDIMHGTGDTIQVTGCAMSVIILLGVMVQWSSWKYSGVYFISRWYRRSNTWLRYTLSLLRNLKFLLDINELVKLLSSLYISRNLCFKVNCDWVRILKNAKRLSRRSFNFATIISDAKLSEQSVDKAVI